MGARRGLLLPQLGVLWVIVLATIAAAAESSREPTAHDFRSLDTSFGRLLAHALSTRGTAGSSWKGSDRAHVQSASAVSATGDDSDAEGPPIDVYWRLTNIQKPTLGDWFQKMLAGMQHDIDAQDQGPKQPGSSNKHYYSQEEDSYGYGDDYHHHKRSDYGGQQYSRGDSYYPYGPEGESFSPYKPSYGHPAKAEDVCLQEVAQSSCEVSGNDRSYTSSLGCCHTPYGRQYYHEPHYPGQSDYYAALARMVNKAKAKHAAHATTMTTGAANTGAASPQGLHKTPASLAHYADPAVFFPRRGKAECQWSVKLFAPVPVRVPNPVPVPAPVPVPVSAPDAAAKQIGTATAICYFNGTMEHCGSPLCEGLALTIQAGVYTTYAVSKYPPPAETDPVKCINKGDEGGGGVRVPTPVRTPVRNPVRNPVPNPVPSLFVPTPVSQPQPLPAGQQQPQLQVPVPAVAQPPAPPPPQQQQPTAQQPAVQQQPQAQPPAAPEPKIITVQVPVPTPVYIYVPTPVSQPQSLAAGQQLPQQPQLVPQMPMPALAQPLPQQQPQQLQQVPMPALAQPLPAVVQPMPQQQPQQPQPVPQPQQPAPMQPQPTPQPQSQPAPAPAAQPSPPAAQPTPVAQPVASTTQPISAAAQPQTQPQPQPQPQPQTRTQTQTQTQQPAVVPVKAFKADYRGSAKAGRTLRVQAGSSTVGVAVAGDTRGFFYVDEDEPADAAKGADASAPHQEAYEQQQEEQEAYQQYAGRKEEDYGPHREERYEGHHQEGYGPRYGEDYGPHYQRGYGQHRQEGYDGYRNREFADFVDDNTEPSGFWGGEATIYAGLVTSVTSLKGKRIEYHGGVVEHVASFSSDAKLLSKFELDNLAWDVPFVKPNGYKFVFIGDGDKYDKY